MRKKTPNLLMQIAKKVKFSTERTQTSVTVNAGNMASVIVPLPTKKAIGLAGVSCAGTGSANMAIWSFNLQSNGVSVGITNTSGTTRSITVYANYIVVDA